MLFTLWVILSVRFDSYIIDVGQTDGIEKRDGKIVNIINITKDEANNNRLRDNSTHTMWNKRLEWFEFESHFKQIFIVFVCSILVHIRKCNNKFM